VSGGGRRSRNSYNDVRIEQFCPVYAANSIDISSRVMNRKCKKSCGLNLQIQLKLGLIVKINRSQSFLGPWSAFFSRHQPTRLKRDSRVAKTANLGLPSYKLNWYGTSGNEFTGLTKRLSNMASSPPVCCCSS
jgi:hypothetical protein